MINKKKLPTCIDLISMKTTNTADLDVEGGSFGPIGSTINELENNSPENNLKKELHRKRNVDKTSTILALILPTHVWLSIQNSSKLSEQPSSKFITEPIDPKDHHPYGRL